MLVQIAWRNIWRNKMRSFVVIGAVTLGIWAGIFILAFSWGLYQGNIRDSVYRQLSHIQIHNPSFIKEKDPKFSIPNTDEIMDSLHSDKRILAASSRLISTGMISSPITASGVEILGIDPSSEAKQIGLNKTVIKGNYFDSKKNNEILIGEKLVKKLKVKLRSKVILTFVNIDSEMISAAFRVGGIYKSKNTSLDEVNVYVQRGHLRELLELKPTESNEIAILLKNEEDLPGVKNYVADLVPKEKVEDWKELSPELGLVIESFNLYTYLISGIILLALIFGIINTMLMSILERVRELGMIMAIGLNKRKLFSMILLETLFLTLIGCPIGLLLGWGSVEFFGEYGINISMFSEGLSSYGFSSVIYPALDNQKYAIISIMCVITSLLASIYPAYRALQLNPSEAIRKI